MNVENKLAPGAKTLSVSACALSLFLTGYPGFTALGIGLFAGAVWFFVQRENKERRFDRSHRV